MDTRVFAVIMVIFLFSSIPVFSDENLLLNPSFEEENNGWASWWYIRSYHEDLATTDYIYETGDAHSGNHYITVRNKRDNDARIYQIIEVEPHTVYKLSAWIKAENIRNGVGGNISVGDSFAFSRDLRNTNGLWEKVELYGITGQYQTRMPVALRVGGWSGFSTGTVSFDDIRAERVTSRPHGVKIESFSFADNYDENIVNDYFIRVNNDRYASHRLYLSFFFAALLFFTALFFSLYTKLLKDKIKGLEGAVTFAFRKLYYVFIAVLFIVFFIVFIPKANNITLYDTQFSFLIVLIIAIGAASYLYKTHQLTPKNVAVILIVLGIALRLTYFIYTDSNLRQHDLWGAWSHLEYIKYAAQTFSLPDVGTYEAYHPPVHYFLSAIPYNAARLFNLGEAGAFRAVELLMVFFSSLTLIFVYKILDKIKVDRQVLLIGVALASFHPSFMYMSVYLNNDSTVAMFYIISFYYLITWVQEKKLKNVILLAVFISLSMLTKKSALILFPVSGIVFLVELFKDKKNTRKYIKHGVIFLIIALPLAFSYQIRNYILFRQDLSYAVAPLGHIMPNNPYNLFHVSVENLLKRPFVSAAPHENTFFLRMLIRTSLFSVFEFNRLTDVAVVMMALYLVFILVITLNFILLRKKDMSPYGYVFLLNFAVTLIVYFRMRLYSPYDCTQAFRYIAPFFMISLSYFAGTSFVRFSGTKYPVLNGIVKGSFWLFCSVSAFFILMIGPPY
ncbi:MAG: glycosyltransferase family 39 protein [Spirochaetales bacterium]|nr:glycosyltransferase family 39 protein [Spirochaetales bacterium]